MSGEDAGEQPENAPITIRIRDQVRENDVEQNSTRVNRK